MSNITSSTSKESSSRKAKSLQAHESDQNPSPSEEESGELPSTCPECSSEVLPIYEHGTTEFVCEDCGLILEEEIYRNTREHSAYNTSPTSGSGSHQSIHESPLYELLHTTTWSTADLTNRKDISSQKRSQMLRARTLQRSEKESKGNSLRFGLGEINRMGSALGLPEYVRETAAVVLRKAVSEGLHEGRALETTSTAALHITVRIEQLPRSLEELEAVSRCDSQKAIYRAHLDLKRGLNLPVDLPTPDAYIERLCSALDLSHRHERKAKALLKSSPDELIGSRDPAITASALILAAGTAFAALETPQQTSLANETGRSRQAIAKATKVYLKALSDSIDPIAKLERSPQEMTITEIENEVACAAV